MNPFRPLIKLLDFVLGNDLHERAVEKKAPEVRPPPRRDPAPRGDGFDSGSRGPRVDLRGGVKAAPRLPDEPAGPPAVIEPSTFNASLEDLSHLVDEPMAPRPEFIPEGGMSTESLMGEFAALDATSLPFPSGEGPPLDFTHVVDEPMQPKPEFVPAGGVSTESLMSEFDSLDAETQAAAIAEAAAKEAARAAEEAAEEAQEEEESHAVEPELLVASPVVPTFVAPGGMSTESLMSEFESLDAETQAAAIADAAAKELARQEAEEARRALEALESAQAEEPVDSFEPSSAPLLDPLPAPQGEGVRTPAWLIPATTAAPKPPAPLPPPELSTESLMSAFEPVAPTEEPVAALVPQVAPLPNPLPAPQGEGVKTPVWLMPATTAAPKPPAPLPPPELSTESLMSEVESLKGEEPPAPALPAPQGEGEKD